MNLAAVSIAYAVAEAPTVDCLVIEDLAAATAEQFQPGTCICWSESALDE